VASDIASKIPAEVKIFIKDVPKEELNALSTEGREFQIFPTDEDFEKILERENPYLTLLPRPKVDPLLHTFKKPWSESLVESTDRWNFLLVQQETEKISKALLYADRDKTTETYLRSAYEFLTAWGIEFHFVTVFDEEHFEILLKKEHPEQEAKELLGHLLEEYIAAVRNRIEKVLQLEKVELITLKGAVGRELPLFAKKHRFDLVVFPHNLDQKEELVENSQTSLAAFVAK